MYMYVVLWGCVDDTSIQGVYSTKAKASKTVKGVSEKGVEVWIEKWKVDDEKYFKTGKQYK